MDPSYQDFWSVSSIFFTEIRFKLSTGFLNSRPPCPARGLQPSFGSHLLSFSVCTLAGNLHLTLPAGSQSTMAALVHQIFCEFFCTFFDIFLRI
jgi:hypothetical protein